MDLWDFMLTIFGSMRIYTLAENIQINIPLLEDLNNCVTYTLASQNVAAPGNADNENYFCVGGLSGTVLVFAPDDPDIICQQFWTCRNLYPKIKYFRGLILLKKES